MKKLLFLAIVAILAASCNGELEIKETNKGFVVKKGLFRAIGGTFKKVEPFTVEENKFYFLSYNPDDAERSNRNSIIIDSDGKIIQAVHNFSGIAEDKTAPNGWSQKKDPIIITYTNGKDGKPQYYWAYDLSSEIIVLKQQSDIAIFQEKFLVGENYWPQSWSIYQTDGTLLYGEYDYVGGSNFLSDASDLRIAIRNEDGRNGVLDLNTGLEGFLYPVADQLNWSESQHKLVWSGGHFKIHWSDGKKQRVPAHPEYNKIWAERAKL